MADQTNAGETGPQTVSAGKCNVWCGGGGGAGLPALIVLLNSVRLYTWKL